MLKKVTLHPVSGSYCLLYEDSCFSEKSDRVSLTEIPLIEIYQSRHLNVVKNLKLYYDDRGGAVFAADLNFWLTKLAIPSRTYHKEARDYIKYFRAIAHYFNA